MENAAPPLIPSPSAPRRAIVGNIGRALAILSLVAIAIMIIAKPG
jgi:hypothetical protein